MRNYIFYLLVLFAFPVSGYACSCSLGTVEKKFEGQPVVFLGTVSNINRLEEKNGFGEDRIQVAFDVEKRWKGSSRENTLDTYDNKVSCEGYWFKEAKRYLIFARKGKNGLTVMPCGGAIVEGSDTFNKQLAFMGRQSLLDKDVQQVACKPSSSEPPAKAFNSYPYWSPDGKRIIFSSNRSGRSELYVIDVDGNNLK
jgi:hypothetical protein